MEQNNWHLIYTYPCDGVNARTVQGNLHSSAISGEQTICHEMASWTCLPVVIIITEETTSRHINVLLLFLFLFLLLLSRGSGLSGSGGNRSSSTNTYNQQTIHE